MGILGEHFEGRHVIGLSGHKNESTIKQYVTKLPTKKKKEMLDTLAINVQPEGTPPTPKKFQFKKPTATVSKPPEAENILPNNQLLDLQPIDDAPPDDVLINLLNQLEAEQSNQVQIPNAPPQVPQLQPPEPLGTNNTMNIQNVSNVQNVSANNRMMPTMYFGGHSSVVINYNFAPPKQE